jgi:hypothetical protein
LSDLYLIHQQGWEGAAEHISQPDRIAWKFMFATSEGVEKGEKWCKLAIWGNTASSGKTGVEIGGEADIESVRRDVARADGAVLFGIHGQRWRRTGE